MPIHSSGDFRSVIYKKKTTQRVVFFGLLALRAVLRHQAGDAFLFQPPLFLRPLEAGVNHTLEIAHVMEIELPLLQADESAVIPALVALVDEIFQAQAGEPGGLDAVEG